jgi:TatA/E family protein of Tat protein translocase
MFLSPVKIMVIVAVVLLLLGPDKLPDVAHRLGSSWRALKQLQERVESEVRDAIPDLPSTGDIARIVRSPINLLNQLSDQVDAKEAAEVKKNAPPAAVAETVPPPPITPPLRPVAARTEDSIPPPDPSLN